jgi:hypothetical protein
MHHGSRRNQTQIHPDATLAFMQYYYYYYYYYC